MTHHTQIHSVVHDAHMSSTYCDDYHICSCYGMFIQVAMVMKNDCLQYWGHVMTPAGHGCGVIRNE